jgi:protein involved in polysaccharide export with SLBB domain
VVPNTSVRRGDCLLIVFVNPPDVPELRQVIDPAGEITMPYGVKVHVSDMTLGEAAGQIEKAYRSYPEGDLAKFKVLVSKCR